MAPERLRRIRAVYEAAVDTPAAERQALLENECRGDEELRQEVEQLLAAREHPPEWLSGPLLGGAIARLLEGRPTVTHPVPAGQVHFPPGAVLAQRYRIVHFLGRGGMGAVFRADDLLLGQPVALKFLPAATTASVSALSRFRNEVRTARQVSHPNVCRVYDIGEAEGLTYLSMEYVDGEDLASLLRRIGKLPHDKALEVARQVCAGLGAAHDKGVIHRDLKPANIMLDGKGQVRITDFGIAGMAEQIRDVHSGTPAYMSPEQLAGKEVTQCSDIYALGTIVCELFTGQRPPLKPSEPGSMELDPAVERVIRRCLDPDPRMRPRSPLSVSAALPGGDPLAAALARGETPAPELVANAGPPEGLRPVAAVVSLAFVIVGLGSLCVLRQKHDLINQIPMENSSEVLAAKAREITRSFGYTDRPADTIFAWNYDADYQRFAGELRNPSSFGARLYAPYPPAVYFWYRQRSHYPTAGDSETYSFNRDRLEPGMQAVVLDSEGRLLEFQARPSAESAAGDQRPFEWSRLFAAAGLDSAQFKAVQPELAPPAAFDTRAAWSGSAQGNDNLKIEAAAFQGRPVWFRVLGPWARRNEPAPFSFGQIPINTVLLFVFALPAVAGLPWRNMRAGRGDRRGAFRLAAALFLLTFLYYLAGTHHIPTPAELELLFSCMVWAIALSGLGWLFYMGFEPQVRRRWPESLISWSRLLEGRIRDPMVGGHLLMGVALGVVARCAMTSVAALPFPEVLVPQLPSSDAVVIARWCWELIEAVAGGLGSALLLSLISPVRRRRWLAAAIWAIVMILILVTSYGRPTFAATVRLAIVQVTVAYTLVRFGVLATIASLFTHFAIAALPLTTNWQAWYAHFALLGLAFLLALALYGFVTNLRGRRPWASEWDAT